MQSVRTRRDGSKGKTIEKQCVAWVATLAVPKGRTKTMCAALQEHGCPCVSPLHSSKKNRPTLTGNGKVADSGDIPTSMSGAALLYPEDLPRAAAGKVLAEIGAAIIVRRARVTSAKIRGVQADKPTLGMYMSVSTLSNANGSVEAGGMARAGNEAGCDRTPTQQDLVCAVDSEGASEAQSESNADTADNAQARPVMMPSRWRVASSPEALQCRWSGLSTGQGGRGDGSGVAFTAAVVEDNSYYYVHGRGIE
ncbi:hypothetical protein B0H10DRAFT_1945963 [Mycena sp. CBHHK59/15]|nr:hypothetical protein B0H10DRAFT_1945963 [Mycena sp. CBHHK59/15]